MPSFDHEAIVALFRRRPTLAAELLHAGGEGGEREMPVVEQAEVVDTSVGDSAAVRLQHPDAPCFRIGRSDPASRSRRPRRALGYGSLPCPAPYAASTTRRSI